jgi:hypothetical protein
MCVKTAAILKRMWVNQPSTLQTYHKWHGVCVLATEAEHGTDICTAYFLSGACVSMRMAYSALSKGWLKAGKHIED